MKRHIGAVLAFIFIVLNAPGAAAAPYYQGKVITIVVGFGPGGGYDRMARIMAKHLPNYIPGKPTILVQNMPGASSMLAANYVYNLAKPDGLTIGTFNRGVVFAQLLKAEGGKFDMTKFAWIGSAAVEASVIAIRNDLPYKTFDDLKKVKEPIPFATMGPGSSDHQHIALLKEFTGLNARLIVYPSSPDAALAVERKEADGRAGSYSSIKPFIDRGMVRPLIRGRISELGIEYLPVDEDISVDKKGKTLMAMRSAPDTMGRPYVAPPGTPEAVMNVLRDAFAKVAKDPATLEDGRKNMMSVQYVPAHEVQKVLQYLLNQPLDIVNEFSKYVKF